MARFNAQEVAEKWSRRLTAATPDMQKGVAGTKINPATQAIAKKDKMRQNLLASIDSGKWERGLQGVTLASWQKAMIDKGIPRVAAGAVAAQPKMQAFMSELLPYQDNLINEVNNMPDLTLEDNIARMSAFVRGMSNFRK